MKHVVERECLWKKRFEKGEKWKWVGKSEDGGLLPYQFNTESNPSIFMTHVKLWGGLYEKLVIIFGGTLGPYRSSLPLLHLLHFTHFLLFFTLFLTVNNSYTYVIIVYFSAIWERPRLLISYFYQQHRLQLRATLLNLDRSSEIRQWTTRKCVCGSP